MGKKIKNHIVTLLILLILPFLCMYSCKAEKDKTAKMLTKEPRYLGCQVFEELPKDINNPLNVNYDNRIKLLGIKVEKSSQNQFYISYYWQLFKELEGYQTAFVHFSDSTQNVLFQNDHDICPEFSFKQKEGGFIKESFLVNIPDTAVGKKLNIKIGLYDRISLKKLTVKSTGSEKTDYENSAIVVEDIIK